MNASRLREIVDLLLKWEAKCAVQTRLKELNQHLESLASSPQDTNLQTKYAEAFTKLQSAVQQLAASLTPTEIRELAEIGGTPYFSYQLVERIGQWIADNPISPTVAQKNVAKLVLEREQFLESLRQLTESLKKLSIEPPAAVAGTAEIGFMLPRSLFQNELGPLIKELGVINRILRAFSEATTGSVPPITVKDISTSDPLFFFGLDPVTIATLGGVVAWALSQWKKVEEIRKLRSETQKNKIFVEDEIKNFFDAKIDKTIKQAVSEKVEALVSQLGDSKRVNEQRTDIQWALESMLARIERGMTVEIRMLPPPQADDPIQTKAFEDIKEAVPQLVFPAAENIPVLQLPPSEPPKKE
jgi:hypothetical protein